MAPSGDISPAIFSPYEGRSLTFGVLSREVSKEKAAGQAETRGRVEETKFATVATIESRGSKPDT